MAENPRLLQLVDPTTWSEQARLASAGEWGVLRSLQDSLKGKRSTLAEDSVDVENIQITTDNITRARARAFLSILARAVTSDWRTDPVPHSKLLIHFVARELSDYVKFQED